MTSARLPAFALFLSLARLVVAQTTVDDQAILMQQLGRQNSTTSGERDANGNQCDPADSSSEGSCATRLLNAQVTPQSSLNRGTSPNVNEIPSFRPGKDSSGRGEDWSGNRTAEMFPPTIKEPPTDFQRFVESSTGKLLPIYGASLFSGVPTTFAPVDQVPVTADYALGPGDEIQLSVWGQINFSKVIVVDRAGDIFLPQAGRVHLAGAPFDQARSVVQTALSRVYRNFDLSLNMGQLRSMQVFVVGYARHPGAFTISSLSTLVNALFASGGPSSGGSLRQIQLRRGGRLITTFDLYDLLLRGDKSKDITLESGDVIFIPAHGPQVALAGSVTYPAIYELPAGTELCSLFEYAGGLSPIASSSEAVLERLAQNRPILESAHILLNEQGLKTALRNGDIVRLLPVVPRFEKSVSVRGNLADPVRLPWSEGMKVSDVIPERQALLTRDYWKEHNRLANEGQSEEKVQMLLKAQELQDVETSDKSDLSLGGVWASGRVAEIRRFASRNSVQPPAPRINWTYAAIERTDPITLATRLIPFNLGKIVIDHDASADILLEPGDVITIFSEADFVAPLAERSTFVRLEGEVKSAGVYTTRPGDTLRDVVERAGGLTNNAYLFGAQFTRESTRLEQQKKLNAYLDQLERDLDQGTATLAARSVSATQEASARASFEQQRQVVERMRSVPASGRIVLNIGRAASGAGALPPIALENGDRLVVPSQPATVSVMGTVVNPSTFLFNSNAPAGDYLRQAGGPTRFADKSNMFILRADGSVFGASTQNGMFKGHFESLRMFPGDTLMVPSNVTKISKVRSLLDWSQILSGFGIAAAAVNVLK